MSRKTIRTVILLGTISLIGIIFSQIIWINSAVNLQDKEVERQLKQDSLMASQFNENVKSALSNVAQQILTINNDPAEIYKAVEQLASNYYVVRINDTLHPYLLEQLLRREFQKSNIDENFQYGIYDCFTDSIVYSDNVSIDTTSVLNDELSEAPQLKWNTDGHYFSVRFPQRESLALETSESNLTPWFVAAAAMGIILIFFAYSVQVILRQKRLSEIKNDFINNMTHELKTPISTISISSEVLLREDISEDKERIKQYAKIISNENKRLESQVERVLQLATLDRDTIDLKMDEIDLNELVEGVADNLRVMAESKNGKVEIDLQADNAVIEGDKVHITNVVNNLIDNAIKYSNEEPHVEIKTSIENKEVVLIVKDHGIGLSKEYQKQIFDKFFRVPTGNVHDVKGFGLGLYYVKLMVDQHNGRIELDSTPGKGSTFKVYLPLHRA